MVTCAPSSTSAPSRTVWPTDNLKAAVARILVGSERELAPRFLALATHYVFEASFARPRTGHDKGGVEARRKGIRWQHLVPIPSGPDLETISRQLLARLDARCTEERDGEGRSIGERFADEKARMLPLPQQRYRAAATRLVGASRRSLVKVDAAMYSVWSDWAGRDVTAYVGVDEVELVGPDQRHVVHRRQRFGGRSVDYRHYLPELARKPQAVRQVAPELMRDLGEPFRHDVEPPGGPARAQAGSADLRAGAPGRRRPGVRRGG